MSPQSRAWTITYIRDPAPLFGCPSVRRPHMRACLDTAEVLIVPEPGASQAVWDEYFLNVRTAMARAYLENIRFERAEGDVGLGVACGWDASPCSRPFLARPFLAR